MLESEDGLKDGAWAYTTGQSNPPIVVAVLDTGIALNPAIVNSLVKDETGAVVGWNFYGNNNNLSDETRSYHGTHVAGTIAGYGDVMNGMGEHLRILVEKIPNKSGMFYESAVINAIYWAVGEQVPGLPNNPYPAKVLNMSFGVDIGPGNEMEYCDQPLQDAVDFARNQGAVLAVAAGNENHWENFSAPAVCNGTLRIASTGPTGLRSYFSNYGPSATFAAPGGDKRYGMTGEILSTVNPGGGYQGSGYDFFQGTSMATPHAAGLAGLLFAVSGGELKGDSIEQLMYATTHDFGLTTDSNHSCVGDKPCGHGILDAENAVKAALMHFEQVFTAPSFSQLATVSCGKGKVKPLPKTLDIASNKWLPISNECQAIENYLHPRLVSVKKGIIHAVYGNVEYKLITEGGKTCQIIGYDGLGC